MLDAYIIEELKRQEEARRRSQEDARPRLEYEAPRDPDDDAAEIDETDRDEDATEPTEPPVLRI